MSAQQPQSLTLTAALGAGLGAAVGIFRNELGFYLIIGAAIGIALGIVLDQRTAANRAIQKAEREKNTDDLIPKF